MNNNSEIIIYQTQDGATKINVQLENDTVWLTQAQMAELFQTTKQNISLHVNNIFKEGELLMESVIKESLTTAADGKGYDVKYYNLDAIISVGYRVKSLRGTQFRIWAMEIIKEFVKKGFVLDKERLKDPKGWDYFDELLAQIREIRASEKRFYQKLRDLFALAIDYKDDLDFSQSFFAEIQNKLLYAVTGSTAPEIIASRSNENMPNMNLTSWKGSIVRKTDIIIAKNYLQEDEIKKLDRLVNIFLDYAEVQTEGKKSIKLADWQLQTVELLKFYRYQILDNKGKISREKANRLANERFTVFEENRRRADVLKADREDFKELETLQKIKHRE